MNREIKFRFWGKFGELNEEDDECEMEMLYGNRFCFFESEPINNLFDCRNFQVMQYTGLKDKNGKEIYEGDIVTIEYGKGVVEYSEKQAMFIINWIGDNEAYNESLAYNPRNYIYGKTRKDIEVIGNIYENPEITQSSE